MADSLLHKLRIMLPGLMALILSGCSITGGTTRAIIQLDNPPANGSMRPLALGSVDREEEGIHLMNVGTFTWGKFNDDDQSILEESLRDTLCEAQKRVQSAGQPVNVHVVIRKYFVGSSNNAVAVFSGVDWALVDQENIVLFQESFYATRECHLPQLCTLGSEKDATNRAIIKRIATKAVAFSRGEHTESEEVEGTYSTYKDAAATMPDSLESWGAMIMAGDIPMFLPNTGPKHVTLGWAEMTKSIDWGQRLAKSLK